MTTCSATYTLAGARVGLQMRPETLFTKVDGAYVAYQVFGTGPVDLVVLQTASTIDMIWDSASIPRFYERLARFSRVIVFDRRGYGSSDPLRRDTLQRWDQWADDLAAVLDAAESRQAVIFAQAR